MTPQTKVTVNLARTYMPEVNLTSSSPIVCPCRHGSTATAEVVTRTIKALDHDWSTLSVTASRVGILIRVTDHLSLVTPGTPVSAALQVAGVLSYFCELENTCTCICGSASSAQVIRRISQLTT